MNANGSMEIKKKRRIQFNLTTTHTETPSESPNNLYDNISSRGMSDPGNNSSNPDEIFPSGIHCDQNDNGNIYDNITHLIFASNACVQRRLPRGILTRNPNMDLVMNGIYDNCEDLSQDPRLIYDNVSAMGTDRNIDLEGERKLTETIYDDVGPLCATIQHEKEKNENIRSPIPTILHGSEKYGNRLLPISIIQHVNDNRADHDYNDAFLDNTIAGCLENCDSTNGNNTNSVNEYNSDDNYIALKWKICEERVERDLAQDHEKKLYGDQTHKDTGQEKDQTGTDRTLTLQVKACREQPETQGGLVQDHKKKYYDDQHGHKYTNQGKYQCIEQHDNYGQECGSRSGGREVVNHVCPDPQVVRGGRRPDQKLKRVDRDTAQDRGKYVYDDHHGHNYTNQGKYQRKTHREQPDRCSQGHGDRSGGEEVVVRGGAIPDQKLNRVDRDTAQDRGKDVYDDQHGHKYTNQEQYQWKVHGEQPDNYCNRSGGREVVVRGGGTPDCPDPKVVGAGRGPDQKLKRVHRDIAQECEKDVYGDQHGHKYTNQERYQRKAPREEPDNSDQEDGNRPGGREVVVRRGKIPDRPDPQVVKGGERPDQKLKRVDRDIAQDRGKDVYDDQHGHKYTNQEKYQRKVHRDQPDHYWNRPGGSEVVVRGCGSPDCPDPQVVRGGEIPDQVVQRTLCPSQFWAMRARTLVLERLQVGLQRCWQIQVCHMLCMMGLGY